MRVNRRHGGFEVTELLLLLAVKPTLTALFLGGVVRAAVLVRHGVKSGQHRRQTEALPSDAYSGNRHHQRRDDVSAGSGTNGRAMVLDRLDVELAVTRLGADVCQAAGDNSPFCQPGCQ